MGKIHSSLSKLISLNYLHFYFCQLSGSIPDSFGNLTQLTHLGLSQNFIRVSNPSSLQWLGKLSKLTELDFEQINLAVQIPLSLANLTRLSYLDLSWNQLTGQVPSWLTNLTQITALHLSFNQLQGPIPISISKLEKLKTLNLDSNNLSGIVSLDIFLKLKYLTKLRLSSNNILFHQMGSTNATQNKF